MRKFVKITILTFIILICVGGISLGVYFASVYSHISKIALNEEKLNSLGLAIEIFDSENRPIKEENMFNGNYVKSEVIPQHTKDAFISIEDKTFIQHNGINYKRMAKAAVNNLKSKSFKEGASTISQQLIKNTHLTSEKTIERKMKEIALTRKLESKFSKDEILEQYLNVIYFGNNCYGIEDASNYYFSKTTHDLTVEESATLAGMIKSPNRYSPVLNIQRCKERRNLVLDEMAKDGKLTPQEAITAKNKPIELKLNSSKQNKLNSYSQDSIDEACCILGLTPKHLAIGGYKVYTYKDSIKQEALEKSIEDVQLDNNDHAGIVIDNSKSSIIAYTGNSAYKILEAKRQPGSCIKPILVYGPALNEDIIYPCTQILDEKTTIAGYSPKNVSGNFNGYVSARDALSKSINIPAVKVLSYVGIDKAKAYASEMGIEFDEKDDSYALALGGMNYGTNIAALAGAYETIANGGRYSTPRFVSYITDKNNKIVYIHKPENKEVLREDSAYLLTDMLKTCAQRGTAKKLNELNLDIASKTGTVGKPNSKLNLDAWNISYTPSYTYGAWIGNLDNTPINMVGGNQPTQIVKNYLKLQPDDSHFNLPNSIITQQIDNTELSSNHRVVLANVFTPERYTQIELFSRFNLPNDISKKFVEIESPDVKARVENGKAIISIDTKDYLSYEIYKQSIDKKNLLKSISGKEEKETFEFDMDENKEKFVIKTYYTASLNNQEDIKEIELIKTKQTQTKQKWYV